MEWGKNQLNTRKLLLILCKSVHIDAPGHLLLFSSTLQEEDLQEIIAKISSKRAELEEARAQMTKLKTSYEAAEQEYKQHKDQISAVAEEADSIKVIIDLMCLTKVSY